MIEGYVMNQWVAKRYRKDYVLRLGLLSLMGIVSLLVLSYPSAGHAIQVTLAWDSPATGTPDGYRLFYRLQDEGYDYSNPDWQGSTNTCTLSNLQDTTTYFVVRAYNAAGESSDSNEAIYQPAATPTPAISRSPASLSTSCTQGSNASGQSFQVWNSGSGTLSYLISTGGTSWLSCSPPSGDSTSESDTITVNYSTSGISAGTYFATITIASAAASNSPQTIPVRLTVNAPSSPAGTSTPSSSPAISWSPASLSTSCNRGWNASKQSFQVSNSGGGTLSYSITDNASWLSCSPASGISTSESDTITVSYNTSKLAVGTYSATITISAAGANSSQTIPVSLTVSQPSGHGRWGRWH